jgi:Icc-related predicted phosphoesterase
MSKIRVAKKADQIFACKPYLQNPVDGGITVMWETTVPAYSWVEYGTDKDNLQRARLLVDGQVICNDKLHKIRIEGLQPGQKYYYRVCSKEILSYKAYSKEFGKTAISEFSTFELPEADEDEFTAIIFNDLHQRTNTFQALLEQVKEVDYDFVFFNGDCIDDPRDRAQASYILKQFTEGVKADQVPVFFMRGNHEIRNAYSIGLRNHFDYVGDKTYGAFNWGDTRIVMLDCGEDKPDDTPVYYDLNDFSQLRKDQVGFLKQEMASKACKKAKKRILIHHIPLYGYEGNLCNDLWRPVLEKAPFDICLNAHLHKYAYYPKGSQKCSYPVIIGGGNSLKDATVIILEKKKNGLKIKVLNAQGETLLDI